MGDILTDSLAGLAAAHSRVKNSHQNIIKASVAGAHRVDAETNYNGKTGGIEVILKRAEDPFLQNLLNKSKTALEYATVIQDGLSILQSAITDPQNNISELVGKVDSFINSAKQITNKPTASLKQSFVKQGENLAKTISDTTNKILDLRLNADSDLSNSLITVNNDISQLFHLNLSMKEAGSSDELLDQRDNLISKIAEFLDIKVSFGANNNALLSTANGSLPLVDLATHARFNYNQVSSKEAFLQEEVDISPITIDLINNKGGATGNLRVVEGFDTSISKIEGGKICGYIKLRDEVLPQAGKAVKSLASQVMNTVNAAHNKYSPFPPKDIHTSTKEIRHTDYIDWSGVLQITPTTKDGKSLVGNSNSGAVRPLSIDLSTLPTTSINGAPTIENMINELNAYFTGLVDNRLALGRITEVPVGAPQPDTYLLNNIKLAGMSNIDANGNFSFDLELDGSKYFGSQVEVLSVISPSGVALNLPQTFDLERGQHTRTNQQITVGGILPGLQNIDVKIRVIGENGIVEEGTARFTINPALPGSTEMLNKRIIGIPAPLVGGSLVATGDDTYAPIARARLVDEDSIDILPGSGIAGKLVIETYNNENGLIITSDQDDTLNGFNHFFGMNDFFVSSTLPGTFKVSKAITDNPLLLSTGAIHLGKATQFVARGTGDAASATMIFSGQPQDGDIIEIADEPFTFRNAPVTATDIQIGVNLFQTLQSFNNAINDNSRVNSVINSSLTLGTTITLTAKNLGTSSATIPVTINFNLFSPGVDLNGNGPLSNLNDSLRGGTDVDIAVEKYEPRIGDDATEFFRKIELLHTELWDFKEMGLVPASTNTILGYANLITDLLSNQLIAAKADTQVAQNIKKDLSTKLQDGVGINKDEEIVKLTEYANSLAAIIAIASLSARLFQETIKTLNN